MEAARSWAKLDVQGSRRQILINMFLAGARIYAMDAIDGEPPGPKTRTITQQTRNKNGAALTNLSESLKITLSESSLGGRIGDAQKQRSAAA